MRTNRLFGLDVFRGWAILLMILFHFAYDLNYFKFITINFEVDTFWIYARYCIVNMFLFSVGVSLVLIHRPTVQWNKMYKRTIVLGAASIIVSIITTIQFSHNWVYFGVLHFILFASWLALIFLPYPKLSLFIAIMILTGSYFGFLHTHALFSLLETPLHLPKHTKDLVPLFPWFSTILLGITLVGFHLEKMFFSSPLLDSPNNFNIFLSFMGRHALIIYLIHQPVLFAICYVFYIYSI